MHLRLRGLNRRRSDDQDTIPKRCSLAFRPVSARASDSMQLSNDAEGVYDRWEANFKKRELVSYAVNASLRKAKAAKPNGMYPTFMFH